MKNFLSIIALFFCLNATAQTDFKSAAQAFENDEFEKTMSILSQLEAKIGANPKIESLRSFTYDQRGDKVKAYASVLRFFTLAGRNSNSAGNKDMENLELSLKTFFENELKQKQQQLDTKRTETANNLVERKKSLQNNRATEKQTKYDSYYEAKIKNAKEDFTAKEIKLIKENIKSKAVETLNEKASKITSLKFSDILYLGQDENVIVDQLYDGVVNFLKTKAYYTDLIRKEKRIKFKKESDYHDYLKGIKDDLRHFLQTNGYSAKREEGSRINDKYLIYIYDVKLPCYLNDVAPFVSNIKGEVDPYYLYTKDRKLYSIGGMVTLSNDIKDFTKNTGLNLKEVGSVKTQFEKIYGSVTLNVKKSDQERNFAKYFNYEYTYSIKTNTFKYDILYFFGPYGYQNGNRDVITGSTLRYVSFSISKL